MEGLLNIFQSIIKLPSNYSTKLLGTLDEHQSFNKPISVVDPIISHISTTLNSPSSRNEGLNILNIFIKQCSLDILEEKISQWIQATTKATTQKSAVDTVKLGFIVLKKLITRSQLIPESTKNVTNNHLAKIIDTIVNSPEQAHYEALDCLESCMQVYAGPCGVYKNQIEKFLLAKFDCPDDVILMVGKCILLLQQTRGGGTQGSLHKSAWAELQTKLIGSLHQCLGQLYSNVSETYDAHGNDNMEELKLPALKLSSEPVTRAAQLNVRFVNLLKVLETVLIDPYPVSKFVQPMKIFRLIFRGLAINCTILAKNPIMDNIALGALLPEIHIQLLNLLQALILVLRGNCILYSSGICDIIASSLKWTSVGKSKGFTKPYILLRKTTYETLSLLCQTLKYGSQVETLAEPLIEHILHDILPFHDEITLKMQTTGNNLSKKAKKKMRKQQNDSTVLSLTHATPSLNSKRFQAADVGNEVLCAAALSALQSIFECCGCFIKPVLHRLLHETVVAQCCAISAASSKSLHGLYSATECRQKLYGALHALVMNPHHLCPAPLQYAATIFGLAQIRDTNPDVRAVAAACGRSLEKILHPQKAVFHFDAEENDIKAALRSVKALKKKMLDHEDSESEDSDEEIEENGMVGDEEPDEMLDTLQAVQDNTKLADETEIATSNDITEINESSDEEVEDVVSSTVVETTKAVENAPITVTHLIEESDDDEVELVKPNQPEKNDNQDSRKRLLSPEMGDANLSAIKSPANKKVKVAPTQNETGIINIETDDESDKDSDILVDELVASFVDELIE